MYLTFSTLVSARLFDRITVYEYTCLSKVNSLYMRLHGTRYRHLVNQEEVVPHGRTHALIKRAYFVVVARLSYVLFGHAEISIHNVYFAGASSLRGKTSLAIWNNIRYRHLASNTRIDDNNIYTTLRYTTMHTYYGDE